MEKYFFHVSHEDAVLVYRSLTNVAVKLGVNRRSLYDRDHPGLMPERLSLKLEKLSEGRVEAVRYEHEEEE